MVTYDHLLHSVFPLFVTPSPITPLVAGITARTFITTVASPLELIRTNLQSTPSSSSNPNTLRSVISSIASLVQKQGPASLWKGLGATLWRDVPFSGLYWANYEGLKSWFNTNGREGASVAFASGAMSGIIAALVTSPFDVLKTRRQALIMSTPSHTTATVPLLKHMIRTEGYSAMYAGFGPRIAKIAPACGIMIACYEVRLHLPPSVTLSDHLMIRSHPGRWELPGETAITPRWIPSTIILAYTLRLPLIIVHTLELIDKCNSTCPHSFMLER